MKIPCPYCSAGLKVLEQGFVIDLLQCPRCTLQVHIKKTSSKKGVSK